MSEGGASLGSLTLQPGSEEVTLLWILEVFVLRNAGREEALKLVSPH